MNGIDKRSKRVVFVSQCILNQNLRFPGIAVSSAACNELIGMLLRHDLGIETLPCLERLGWGGIARQSYFRYQKILLRYAGTPFYGALKQLSRLWVFQYRLRCRKEARRVVRFIIDYRSSGYTVAGIVAMNDSPTDGVSQTIDLINAPMKIKTLGIDPDLFQQPNLDDMKKVIPRLCDEGTGIFMSCIMKELEKKMITINTVGYDPWGDPGVEAQRVEEKLGFRMKNQ
ncbi:MAG: hypothetical protein C0403_17320 [Desulfobacterium sp.]|nr:hypothetical protein [Desulfobacterium sp.]